MKKFFVCSFAVWDFYAQLRHASVVTSVTFRSCEGVNTLALALSRI